MTPERDIATDTFTWRGITIQVEYEADWLGAAARGSFHATAHLQLRTLCPERAQLPVTETGYRSHFLPMGEVEAAGGPVAYALAWLDYMAQSREWRRIEQESRQLSLF
jgi:hypothetical protein